MAYVLECMWQCIVSAVGGKDSVMLTTGKIQTWKDVWVGIAGWFVIFVTIIVVVLVIRRYKRR